LTAIGSVVGSYEISVFPQLHKPDNNIKTVGCRTKQQ